MADNLILSSALMTPADKLAYLETLAETNPKVRLSSAIARMKVLAKASEMRRRPTSVMTQEEIIRQLRQLGGLSDGAR